MAPVTLAAELLQVLLEESTHGDDAISHTLNLTQPLLVQSRIVENLRSDAGTMNGRVGIKRSYENLDLRVDALLLLSRLTCKREGSDTLSIETLSADLVLIA